MNPERAPNGLQRGIGETRLAVRLVGRVDRAHGAADGRDSWWRSGWPKRVEVERAHHPVDQVDCAGEARLQRCRSARRSCRGDCSPVERRAVVVEGVRLVELAVAESTVRKSMSGAMSQLSLPETPQFGGGERIERLPPRTAVPFTVNRCRSVAGDHRAGRDRSM